MVKVGQVVVRTPETIIPVFRTPGSGTKRPMKGTVVYVHPKGRYHIVEFEVLGVPIRESFLGVEEEEVVYRG